MTPAEHYAEAERLLDLADQVGSLRSQEATIHGLRDLLTAAQVHATLATYVDLDQPVRVVLPGPAPAPIPPLPGSNGGDRRPHSRACGLNCRGHGRECSTNCPTCHGSADESTWRPW